MQDNGIPIDSDRDLLIKVATDVKHIREKIIELAESNEKTYTLLSNRCDCIEKDVKEAKTRIEKLEQWRAYVIGIAAVITFVIMVLAELFQGRI